MILLKKFLFTDKAFEKRIKEEKLLSSDFSKIADKLITLISKVDSRLVLCIRVKSNMGRIEIQGSFSPNIIDTCDKLE
jgi:hypothetical protein